MCTSSFTARGGYLHLNCSLRLFHTLWALLPARSLYAVRCVACPCFLYGASAIPRQVGWAARWRGGSSQKDRFVRSTQSALSASSFNLFFLLLGIQPIILFVGPHKQNNYCFLSVFTCTDVGRLAVARQYVTWSRVYTASCTWLTPLAAAAPHTICSTPAVSRCSSYCDAYSDTLCEWTIALLETAVGVVSVSNNFILRASDLKLRILFPSLLPCLLRLHRTSTICVVPSIVRPAHSLSPDFKFLPQTLVSLSLQFIVNVSRKQ